MSFLFCLARHHTAICGSKEDATIIDSLGECLVANELSDSRHLHTLAHLGLAFPKYSDRMLILNKNRATHNQQNSKTTNRAPATLFTVSEPHILSQHWCRPTSIQVAPGLSRFTRTNCFCTTRAYRQTGKGPAIPCFVQFHGGQFSFSQFVLWPNSTLANSSLANSYFGQVHLANFRSLQC